MAFLGLLSSTPPPISLLANISNSKSQFPIFQTIPISPPLSTFPPLHSTLKCNPRRLNSFPKVAAAASSSSSSSSSAVGSVEYIVEPTTKVKFETSLRLPGCSSPLSLYGTGYREKVFAIIGVKVYAVGLYADFSIIENLNSWKGRSEAEYQEDPSFFRSIYNAPMEKALQIILVRDIDGKTFWNALNDAISPRIKAPTSADDSALSTFRSIFQGRPLNKGTAIFLTWPDTSKMLVFISGDGSSSTADTTIESTNINYALFDVFFGDAPVSPSLKASVCNEMAKVLK